MKLNKMVMVLTSLFLPALSITKKSGTNSDDSEWTTYTNGPYSCTKDDYIVHCTKEVGSRLYDIDDDWYDILEHDYREFLQQ